MDVLLLVVLLILGLAFYFLPAIIGVNRDHENSMGITLLNLFLGWTLIGWVAALVWSVTAQTDKPIVENVDRNELRDCPYCAEPIRSNAIKCKHCGSDVQPLSQEQKHAEKTPSTEAAAIAEAQTDAVLEQDRAAMEQHGITDDGIYYHFGGYRYDKLSDALAYAQKQMV